MKHDFSTEWHKFLYPPVPGGDQKMSISLCKEHFPFFTKDRNIVVKKIEILIKAKRTGDYKMFVSATGLDNTAIASSEISMPESAAYANMKKVTLTDNAKDTKINVEDLDVFKTIELKFKYNTDFDYHSIDTSPEEISDVFLVVHYVLGDDWE